LKLITYLALVSKAADVKDTTTTTNSDL